MYEFIWNKLGVTSITNKLKENWLRWYKHVLRWSVDALIRKLEVSRWKVVEEGEGEVDVESA